MAKILITSGPTRQYLDPVRYLTNASSGRMGAALATAAISAGHSVVIISGPVEVEYPDAAEVIDVISTEEMLMQARRCFVDCDGAIGVAAPCDYRPRQISDRKLSKTGQPLMLELIETPDVIATLGAEKGDRWVVGFALETDDHRFRAITKLEIKSCDLIVLNSPTAMNSLATQVELLEESGDVVGEFAGPKLEVARQIFSVIEKRLIDR